MKTVQWKLFLDDVREVTDIYDDASGFTVARNLIHAKTLIQLFGIPHFISFDHDLGGDETGYELVKWMVDLDMESPIFPPDFQFRVHSANPVGRKNIECYLNNYLHFKGAMNDTG
jgi:hypothetical protein